MRRFADIVKKCDVKKVLSYLTRGYPPDLFECKLEEYYMLYCMICDWPSEQNKEALALTGIDVQKTKSGETIYYFKGIVSPDVEKTEETVITDIGVLEDAVDILVPDTLIACLPEEFLVGEMFRKLESCPKDPEPPEYKEGVCLLIRDAYEQMSFLNFRTCIEAVQKNAERILYDDDLHGRIVNEILEYYEMRYSLMDWGSMLARTMIFEDDTVSLDKEDPPSYLRVMRKQSSLAMIYRDAGIETHEEVKKKRYRIIVAPHGPAGSLPYIYVRDHYGKVHELREFRDDHLVCMDIRILDPSLTSKRRVLSVLIYYLEYSIRLSRIKKRDGVAVLLHALKQIGDIKGKKG